mgnify:CR=1 FL=1
MAQLDVLNHRLRRGVRPHVGIHAQDFECELREFGLAVEAFTLSCNFVALRVVHESLKDGPLTTQRAAIAVAAAAICRACLASALAQISPAADAMLQSLLQPRAQTFQSRAYQFL